jgi:alkyl hydroperoxide reductase subunit AhpC
MDQFAQLRDRVNEFEQRKAQVFFVLTEEAAYIRQWLRSRDKWDAEIPDFFEDSADKHPWLRSRGTGPEESRCPVIADPSCTTSADYGRSAPATFVIDPDGIIRLEHRGKGTFDRPPVDQLLKALDGEGKTKK